MGVAGVRGFRKLFSLLALAWSVNHVAISAWAGEKPWWVTEHWKTDADVYNPLEFYGQFSSPFFAEMSGLRPDTKPGIGALLHRLAEQGYPIYIGSTANFQMRFDILAPFVTMDEGRLGDTFGGYNSESNAGNLSFIFHDSAHKASGMIRITQKDVATQAARDATKKKIVTFLLEGEHLASAFTLMDYMRWYWNWREKERTGTLDPEFERLNNGAYSFGELTRERMFHLVGDAVLGNPVHYFFRLLGSVDPGHIRDVRTAGVPMVFPKFYRWMGKVLESWTLAGVLPALEPVHAFLRKGGYRSFKQYAGILADQMMQPWYVAWSERYEVGRPLDQALAEQAALQKRFVESEEQIGPQEPPQPFTFESRFLLNEIRTLARKHAELRLQVTSAATTTVFDRYEKTLGQLYDDAKSEIASAAAATTASNDTIRLERILRSLRLRMDSVISDLSRDLPADLLLPESARMPYWDYQQFWADPSIGATKLDLRNLTNLNPPDVMQAALARRSSEAATGASEQPSPFAKFVRSLKGRNNSIVFRGELGARYNEDQDTITKDRGIPVAPTSVAASELPAGESNSYRLSMIAYRESLGRVLENTFVSIVREWPNLPEALRVRCTEAAHQYAAIAKSRVAELVTLHRQIMGDQVTGMGDVRKYHARLESVAVSSIDRALEAVFELTKIRRDGEKKPDHRAIEKQIKRIEYQTRVLENPTEMKPGSSWSRGLSTIFPILEERWSTFRSLLFGKYGLLRRGRDVHKLLGRLDTSAMVPTRDPSELEPNGWTPEPMNTGPLENHAEITLLVMDHEQPLIEAVLARNTFEAMGITDWVVLTKGKAWMGAQYLASGVPNIAFVEDKNFTEKIIARAQKSKRFGILIFPEGQPRLWFSQMPLSIKNGAFRIASRVADELGDRGRVSVLFARTNAIDAVTTTGTENPITFRYELAQPTLAPQTFESAEASQEWVRNTREAFEEFVYHDLQLRWTDLIDPTTVPGGTAPVTGPEPEYLSLGHWLNRRNVRSCGMALETMWKDAGLYVPKEALAE